MKIQLDLDKKTIKLDENANFGKVCEFLQKTFPETWKDFELLAYEDDVIEEVSVPWIYRPYGIQGTYCGKASTTISATNGTVTDITSGAYYVDLN